jgi:K+-sensing histidine kinase KdpD
MENFMAGLATGCLLGVSGTFLLLLLGAIFSGEHSLAVDGRSLRAYSLVAIVLVLLSFSAHKFNFDKGSSMLLFLLAILAVSKIGGLINGMIASGIAALSLVVWYFPPLGSLMVKNPADRFSLALFILIAGLTSRFVGKRDRSISSISG